MRSALLALAITAGCGPVRLGSEEPSDEPPHLDAASVLDAGAMNELGAVITISAPEDAGCGGCVDLIARGTLGTPPYTFEWEDGSKEARRHVCAASGADSYAVSVRDALGRMSIPHAVRLELPEKVCVDASTPELCLRNPSFEGKPAVNTGGVFDAPPWSDCTHPSRLNLPHVTNQSLQQWVTMVPQPSDGDTFLGLQEGMQASEELCATVPAGESRSFTIDLQKLDISSATLDNSEQIFLAAWSGEDDCGLSELLWVSPPLEVSSWQTYCVTLTPHAPMRRLILKAISDDSQLATAVMVADNIVPVASCN